MTFHSRFGIAMVGLLSSLLLAGCGGNLDELDAWMADVRAQDHGPIEPLPAIKPYVPFSYNASAKRAPFDVPVRADNLIVTAGVDVAPPDANRPKEPLEAFNLESLRFVGVWAQNGRLWALVNDGEIVHRVREGNYMGRNDGRIVEATAEYLSVIEKVANGSGGWLERPRTLRLQND